ncbi:UNVERIFIED_CONTAM: hypothetical protein PYX00_010643 [Menopon gallinae]|uniref:Uncharacterized protein n=1 Tax=Menopon gallinae TaxID=328185 RepID=A0AAW2HGC0_9NEOP
MAGVSGRNDHHCITVEPSPASVSVKVESEKDLPSYEEAVKLPPSYESLFGQLKEETRCSGKELKETLYTIASAVHFIFALALLIAFTVIGSMYIFECPREEKIPILLVLVGVRGLFGMIVHYLKGADKTEEKTAAERVKHLLSYNLVDLCNILWCIIESYNVYSIFEPNYDPDLGSYCNETLYTFAFWTVTTANVLLGGFLFAGCSVIVCVILPRRDVIGSTTNQTESAS